MRQRFDENRCIKDMRIASDLVSKGEEELFKNTHWHIRKCNYKHHITDICVA